MQGLSLCRLTPMAPKGRGRKIANVTNHTACHNLAENDQEKLVGLQEKKGPLKRLLHTRRISDGGYTLIKVGKAVRKKALDITFVRTAPDGGLGSVECVRA